jgi:hypothetical protein
MKRLIAPSRASAIGWWANNKNALSADCIFIKLPNGQSIFATSGQWPVTIPASMSPTGLAMTFQAVQKGVWTRGKIVSEAGFKCSANTMTLSCVPKPGALYPGLNVGLLNAALNHLFDGATVWVYTAWMPIGQWGNVQVVETKFQGQIVKAADIGRSSVQFECADPMFLLNMKVPSRLIQSNCPWVFADDPTGALGRCALDPANYTVAFTAAAGSTVAILQPVTAFTQPDGYFTQGVVTCVTGANAGLSQTVKAHTGGAISVTAPWLLPVAAGDTFTAIKGCDQTPTTCAGMTRTTGVAEPNNWQQRFGGTPYVPAPTTSL